MIRVVCSLVAVVLTSCQALGNEMLISPCPKVFKYEIQVENRQPLAKRWYGVVNLATNVTYHALWLNVILDRKADILGSWIGEVTTKDNIDFMIENLNITINPEQRRTACFFVQYSSDFQPKVKSIFVNGREVCHAHDTDAQVDKPIPSLNNNGCNNKSRIKSAERTVPVPIIKSISKKVHHNKKIIRTTTSKPCYQTHTTIKRTQTTTKRTQTTTKGTRTSTRRLKNIQPIQVIPKRKTQLFFLKKSKNDERTSIVIVGNSTCISCKSNVNNESTKRNYTIKEPTIHNTTTQQEDNNDKNLLNNIQTFNNLTSTEIRGDDGSKIGNNQNYDNSKTSTNAFVESDGSTTSEVADDDQSFEIMQTAETTLIMSHILTTTQMKGDNRLTTNSDRKLNNVHAANNTNLTTKFSATRKINSDDGLQIDKNRNFFNFHTVGNETLTTQIQTTTKIRDDNRPKTNNDQRFINFHTTGNANLTTPISTTMKIKVDDKPKVEHNKRFDNLQTGQNTNTTEISTTRKIKDTHILKIANNHRFGSLQTTSTPFKTTSIWSTSKNTGNDRANTGINRSYDNLQNATDKYSTTTEITVDDRVKIDINHSFDTLEKALSGYITTNISTTWNVESDDRRNRRTNNGNRFDNLETATIRYIDISNSRKIKGGGGSNPDDFEVENNEDGLDTLGVIGLPETSGRPQIDTTPDYIPSSHLQTDIRDIFRQPIRDEEEEIHTHGDLAVINPSFDSEPTCGKVLKTRQMHLPYGSSTSEGQWPWQVAIYQQRTVDLKYICGGTLVSQRHIITAAHCVTRKRTIGLVHPKTITVYLGKFNLRLSVDGVQIRFVKNIRVHPEYNSTTYSRDLAILELRSPADITDLVRPVCLWPEDEISLRNVVGQTGSVVGWSFEDSSLTNAELHLTEMPVFQHETCINAFDNFYNTLLSEYTYCAGYKQGTDTCNSNDSGGGMVFKKGKSWYLRGIVSLSISLENEHRCDSKHFIVFTDIAKFLAWIRDYTDE